jgi:hypothetical protein
MGPTAPGGWRIWFTLALPVPLVVLMYLRGIKARAMARRVGVVIRRHALSAFEHQFLTVLLPSVWSSLPFADANAGRASLLLSGSTLVLGALIAVELVELPRNPYMKLVDDLQPLSGEAGSPEDYATETQD